MAKKNTANRTTERRKREKEMGMERLDISLHQTTMEMLMELVKAAGYELKSREKSRGITGVLTQMIYELHLRQDKVTLSRQEQQGFILAQKLQTLRDAGMAPGKASEYIAEQKPSDYLDTEDTKWSKKTRRQLIKNYGDMFGEGSTAELPPPESKNPVQTKKKVSKKKAQAKRG